MCNNCNITLDECSIPKEPYICQKSFSDSGFKCDGCEDLFGSFKCTTDSCKQTFYKVSDLFSHTIEYHTYNPKETESHSIQNANILDKQIKLFQSFSLLLPSDIPKDFKCKVYQKHFIEQGQLKRHMTMFHGHEEVITDMSRKCSICKITLENILSVKRHMMFHTAEKLFSCDKCKRNFTQKANMERHIRLHFSKPSKLPTH